MEKHITALQTLCRICGHRTFSRRDKLNLKDEILFCTGIDVIQDQPEIHPSYICGSDAAKLYRYRAGGSSELFAVTTFSCHSDDDCDVCKTSLMQSDEKHLRPKRLRSSDNVDRSRELDDDRSAEAVLLALHGAELEQCITNVLQQVSFNQRCKIMHAIGCAIANDLKRSLDNEQNSRDAHVLHHFTVRDHVSNQCPLITHFLSGLCHKELEEMLLDNTGCRQMALATEQICKVISPNYIGMFSFLHTLNIYGTTKSKTATNISASGLPGGTYSTITRWLDSQGSTPLKCPDGDIIVMFDNNQIVGKTWTIKPNNKVHVSVVTNVGAVILNREAVYECQKELHPRKWFKTCDNNLVANTLLDNDSDDVSELKQIHDSQVLAYVAAAIELVLNEQQGDIDFVDEIVADREREKMFRLCPNTNCGTSVVRSKRKCPACGGNMSCTNAKSSTPNKTVCQPPKVTIIPIVKDRDATCKPDPEHDRYPNISTNHSGDTYPVHLLEPIFTNPNSTDSIISVLREIGRAAGVTRYGGNSRSWLPICCDGLPFGLMIQVIDNYLYCQECNKGVMGTVEFVKHAQQNHPSADPAKLPSIREFDWVLPVVADGHYEMNLVKAFTELNWDICFKDLAMRMGWRSPVAQKTARACRDHHKSWQLFLVYFLGTLQELVLPYVRACQQESQQPTAVDFLENFAPIQCQKFQTYSYQFEMTTKYAQGIMNFRMGVRRNNCQLVKSARYMTRGLFHGRNHPNYQKLEIYKAALDEVMPPELSTFMSTHTSVSKSGCPSKGQGYDFLLEEENKDIKKWMRRGVATDKTWSVVTRSKPLLSNIRQQLLEILHISEDDDSDKKHNLTDAVNEWRVAVRQYDMLNQALLVSSDGQELDAGLLSFTSEANRRRTYRVLQNLLHQTPPDDLSLRHPVPVTPTERNNYMSINNHTIAQIDTKISKELEKVTDDDLRRILTDTFNKNVLRKRKDVHIEFLLEVQGFACISSSDLN